MNKLFNEYLNSLIDAITFIRLKSQRLPFKNIFREKNNPSYIMGPSVFRPYPGSKLYNMCVESGFKPPETLEDWERIILPGGHFKLDNMPWYDGGS